MTYLLALGKAAESWSIFRPFSSDNDKGEKIDEKLGKGYCRSLFQSSPFIQNDQITLFVLTYYI